MKKRNYGKSKEKKSKFLSLLTENSGQTFYEKIKPLKPVTKNQQKALNLLLNPEISIIFLTGFARSGKTYIPAVFALDQLREGEIKKIVLTRPAKEACGEELGFLPGLLTEKFAPYIRPFEDIFKKRMPHDSLEGFTSCGKIVPFPLGFMRSMTFHDCYILADEMQSASFEALELLLTRKGDNTRIIVSGDYKRQKDIKNSGLEKMVTLLKGKPYVGVVDFELDDIVFPDIKDLVYTFYLNEIYG